MLIQTPISVGEFLDKLSILKIKMNYAEGQKLENVQKEFHHLNLIYDGLENDWSIQLLELYEINHKIWAIEDNIRKKERDKVFDDEFIQLARSVYYTNDKRAEIKRQINSTYASSIVEEKVYADYK